MAFPASFFAGRERYQGALAREQAAGTPPIREVAGKEQSWPEACSLLLQLQRGVPINSTHYDYKWDMFGVHHPGIISKWLCQ